MGKTRETDSVLSKLPTLSADLFIYLRKKWGSYDDFGVEDYLKMESYEKNTLNYYNFRDEARRDMIRKLALVSVLIDKKLASGDTREVSTLISSYQSLMKESGIQNAVQNDTETIESLSELIAFLEEHGWLMDYKVTESRDIVDATIRNFQQYVAAIVAGSGEEITQMYNTKLMEQNSGTNVNEEDIESMFETQEAQEERFEDETLNEEELIDMFKEISKEYENSLDDFIDAYHHMYSERNDIKRIVVTPDYVMNNWDNITYAMRILYLYPDYFIDIVKRKNTYLQQVFFYQRVFLRVMARYQKVSGIFVRAYSKSFLNFISINMKAMWQPMSKLFLCADTKKQAAMITKEKMNEVYYLIPFFVNELDIADFDKQKQHYSTGGEDQAKLKFRNGSAIDIVSTTDSARGGRRHGGTIEEFSLANQDEIENVVIPLLNVNRKTMCGKNNPTEPHASQIMIGSAGYKNTYAYNLTVEMLVDMVFEPDKVFVLVGIIEFQLCMDY